jgi:hypothetical protein
MAVTMFRNHEAGMRKESPRMTTNRTMRWIRMSHLCGYGEIMEGDDQ